MRLRSALTGLTVALVFPLTALCATEANSFNLVQTGGKVIGRASYTIDTNKDGSYRVRSRFEYRITAAAPRDVPATTEGEDGQAAPDQGSRRGGAGPAEAQFSGEYKVDANGNLLSGFTQDAATQMMTSYQPGKPREQLTIGRVQGSVNGGTQPLTMPKPEYILLPNYDPGALQILLTTALAHPHSDNTYLLVVPSMTSRSGGAQPLYIILQPVEDGAGTIDGKPVTLKHYRLNYNKGKAEVYLDADGKLMEADMGPLGASYVRARFTLGGK